MEEVPCHWVLENKLIRTATDEPMSENVKSSPSPHLVNGYLNTKDFHTCPEVQHQHSKLMLINAIQAHY